MKRILVAAAVVTVLSGCGGPAGRSVLTPGPEAPKQTAASGTSTGTATAPPPAAGSLAARLVTAADLPSGYAAERLPPQSDTDVPAAGASCGAPGWLLLVTTTQLPGRPTAIAATSLFDNSGDDMWIGQEVLRSYPAVADAQRALATLSATTARCPTVAAPDGTPYQSAIVAGPRLGDESVSLSCRIHPAARPSVCDSVVVRVGASIVVVRLLAGAPGDERRLPGLAATAVKKFQVTGS